MDLKIHPPLPARKDFRIGVLGSGFIVDECHLVAYRKAGFNPVAIASRNRANAAETAATHGIAKVHDSYEDLLADKSIAVLDIAVPPHALFPLIQRACSYRNAKGILVQKPLGVNYADAQAIVSMCQSAGITLAVNQNMRFDQSVRAAKTLLGNGTIGEPVLATIEMRGIPHWQPWQAELGWATLRIMSIHHLDTFRYWFGMPERIFCSTRTDPRTPFLHTDGICTYVLEYANGLRCIAIDDTWTGPAKEGCPADNYIRWRIEGTNGLAIGDIGWCKNPYTTPSTIRYAAKGDPSFHSPTWPESWFPDAFIGTMADLLIALENKTEPSISGADNLKTMLLVDTAYASARTRNSISLAGMEPDASKGQTTSSGKKKWWDISSWRKAAMVESSQKIHRPAATSSSMNNFSPRSMQVLALARKEADRMNHNFVGTEHLLLGLIALGQGTAVNVLRKLGLHLETVREEVKKHIGPGPEQKIIGNIPYTPRVKKVLAFAAKEAMNLNHTYVGTEHVLLGILREGDGVAARVLKIFNVDLEATRLAILKELDPNTEGIPSQPSPIESKPETSPANSEHPPKSNIFRLTGLGSDYHEDLVAHNFTPRAQRAILFARDEARRLNHDSVGAEHVLLGLISLEQGVAVNALQKLGFSVENIRKEIEKEVGKGAGENTATAIPYTARAKNVFLHAVAYADKLNHTYIGTEHVLLGLLEEREGLHANMFKNRGISMEEMRREILRELDPNFEPPKQ